MKIKGLEGENGSDGDVEWAGAPGGGKHHAVRCGDGVVENSSVGEFVEREVGRHSTRAYRIVEAQDDVFQLLWHEISHTPKK